MTNYADIPGTGDFNPPEFYDDSEGWEEHSDCNGKGCEVCEFEGGQYQGECMSRCAFDELMLRESEEART